MPKIDVVPLPVRQGSLYPAPFHEPCINRIRKALGDAGGLSQFGVNLLRLPPGAWSSQRHWHSGEDEFVYVLEGEVVLIDDAGEHVLRAGDCAGFPKGDGNGHHLLNRSGADALCLEIGSRAPGDKVVYSDIDLKIDRADPVYRHKDGTAYPKRDGA